jgi:hypothetical protein
VCHRLEAIVRWSPACLQFPVEFVPIENNCRISRSCSERGETGASRPTTSGTLVDKRSTLIYASSRTHWRLIVHLAHDITDGKKKRRTPPEDEADFATVWYVDVSRSKVPDATVAAHIAMPKMVRACRRARQFFPTASALFNQIISPRLCSTNKSRTDRLRRRPHQPCVEHSS